MRGSTLTAREGELLHTLLVQRGITKYQVIEEIGEGKSLPGSTYPCEIESISGMVIAPEKVYAFWLDWIDGHYTLGEEEGIWKELRIEELGRDRDRVMKIQHQLREKEEG